MVNALNMKKLNAQEEIEKLAYVIFCPDISKCRLDKYFYYAKQAHENYLYTLKDSREGVNLNTKRNA